MADTFLIVGGGLAGASAAITLRQEGFDGRVLLIGAEAELPYERPPLSKQFLRGEMPAEKALIRPFPFYEERDIELRLGIPALSLDPESKTLTMGDGEVLSYDKVLIATGGRNRRPPIPGLELAGVQDLRTIADASRIRAHIPTCRSAVVVGMGFIGSEVAASLRTLGVEVTVIESRSRPIDGALGPEISSVLEDVHRENGVKMFFGDRAVAFEGDGKIERVKTRNGLELECDLLVIGVGIEPVTDLMQDTGVKLDNGILVDEYFRTNVESIFAAGDVANSYHPMVGSHVRVEHWQNAIDQGTAAAKSMLGLPKPRKEVPWFWSDQYDLNIQYAGFAGEADEIVFRGLPESRNFIAFYLRSGKLRAAAAVNRPRDLRRAMHLIEAGKLIEPNAFRDENVDLRSLA